MLNIVSYLSLAEFDQMEVESLKQVRIDFGATRTPSAMAVRMTPYVMMQHRYADELHVIKFIDKTFEYLRSEFEEAQVSSNFANALGWTEYIKNYITNWCADNFWVIKPGYYWQGNLRNVPGMYFPKVTSAEGVRDYAPH